MKKITKIGINPNSDVPHARSVEEYRCNIFSDDCPSPPIEYWVAGDIVYDIAVGNCMLISRFIRNGVVADGVMRTSRVEEIVESGDATYVLTKNSVYKVEEYTP